MMGSSSEKGFKDSKGQGIERRFKETFLLFGFSWHVSPGKIEQHTFLHFI